MIDVSINTFNTPASSTPRLTRLYLISMPSGSMHPFVQQARLTCQDVIKPYKPTEWHKTKESLVPSKKDIFYSLSAVTKSWWVLRATSTYAFDLWTQFFLIWFSCVFVPLRHTVPNKRWHCFIYLFTSKATSWLTMVCCVGRSVNVFVFPSELICCRREECAWVDISCHVRCLEP